MQPFALAYDEILEHLHPLSPRPRQSQLTRITYDLAPERQQVTTIEMNLRVAGITRVLRFRDIWLNSDWGELRLPYPLGSGILVVDAVYRGWEQTILAVGEDEDFHTLFAASAVEERSDCMW